ncbi:MAG: DUF3445 domain-containing protein [Cyanobacteria bacterium P01_F01_bin.4]
MKRAAYFPFKQRGWQLAMGLHPLPVGNWIDIDSHFAQQLARKKDLLTHRHDDVWGSLPESYAAQQETLETLLDHLQTHFPDVYQRQGDEVINQATQQRWYLNDFADNPLDLAGRLVQEDLCIMQPGPEGYFLAAASLCFPFKWKLLEKLGLPMAKIHKPVPGYKEKLQNPVNGLFERLKPEYPSYRFNWGVVDTPELFLAPEGDAPGHAHGTPKDHAPQAPSHADYYAIPTAEELWLRVERQTLRRLEKTGAILFTIHTYLHPIAELVKQPLVIGHLMTALDQIPKDMQEYKNLPPLRAALLAYLSRSRD